MFSAQIVKAVTEHFAEDFKDIQTIANQANWCLHFGPIHDDPEWPGFEAACRQIREWIDENVSQVYVDDQDFIHTSEPQATGGQCPFCEGTGLFEYEPGEPENCEHPDCDADDTFAAEEVSEIETLEIVRILFGELAQYVR